MNRFLYLLITGCTEKKKAKIIFILFILIGFPIYYNMYKQGRRIKKARCEIVHEEVRGVVTKRDGAKESGYYIDSKQKWYVMMYPLSDDCFIVEVGDSIIKKANSKEVVIKRGNKTCIAHLSCNE